MSPSGKEQTEHRAAAQLAISEQPAPLRRVLTVGEVSIELRCSKAHVHNLINGKIRGSPPLPSVSVGRRRLVRAESLYEWIKANEHTPE